MAIQLYQNLFGKMRESIELGIHLRHPRITLLALFPVLGFPFYYFVWHHLFPQPYENMGLRLLGSLLFVPFLFPAYLSQKTKLPLALHWYFAFLYALPFFFTFMLLKNEGSQVWHLSCLSALFLMILLLDWLNLLVQLAAGIALATLAYYLGSDSVRMPDHLFEYLPIYLFVLVGGSLMNIGSAMLKAERLRAMRETAGTVAHELRTPLLGIKSGASGLRRYLPALIEAYRSAREQQLAVPAIRNAHLDSLEKVLERIISEADYSNIFIDMLLLNATPAGLPAKCHIRCSMNDCVQRALARYPFSSDEERQLVRWNDKEDFAFRGSDMLMIHVLFNLLKNSLYSLARAGRGEITIGMSTSGKKNRLVFRDSGGGIAPERLPHIFQRFAGEHEGVGNGIGLNFCKTVMESFGGSIACDSKPGEYTEFVMTYPVEP